ncbi:MAG TPA: transporter, partial [Clostridiaceae bacterium]|nr:transporter [Clostridiaceae bacterium]
MEMDYGILSLLPAVIALILAFITKDAIFSLLVGVLAGILTIGQNPLFGFTGLLQDALGNADFIWVLSIEVFVGIMIAYFQKSGAIQAFSNVINRYTIRRMGAQVLAWLLGIFIFFSDYFSPLYVGTVMREVTDKAKVSREKLAYICDSTSAPVCTLIPFSSWGVYMAGLLVGAGIYANANDAMTAVIRMVPYNFYGIFSVLLVGLIAFGIVPDYGPMKKAEKRAMETGKVLADGAVPLIGKELEEIKPPENTKAN